MKWIYAVRRFFKGQPHRIETSEVFPPNIRTAWVAPIHPMMHPADLVRLKSALRRLEKESLETGYTASAVKLVTEAFAEQEAFGAILGTAQTSEGRSMEVLRRICAWEMPVRFTLGTLAKELLEEYGSLTEIRVQLRSCPESHDLKGAIIQQCKSLIRNLDSSNDR